jgi:fructose-1,6-bisphosphatase/inositol monophosphatase family enzyme
LVLYTSFDYFRDNGQGGVFDAVNATARSTRGWSDCYAHVLVATGRADAVVEPGIHPWDIAPMTVILAEAGGRATDWDGETTAHARSFLATNGIIHGEMLSLLSVALRSG